MSNFIVDEILILTTRHFLIMNKKSHCLDNGFLDLFILQDSQWNLVF